MNSIYIDSEKKWEELRLLFPIAPDWHSVR